MKIRELLELAAKDHPSRQVLALLESLPELEKLRYKAWLDGTLDIKKSLHEFENQEICAVLLLSILDRSWNDRQAILTYELLTRYVLGSRE